MPILVLLVVLAIDLWAYGDAKAHWERGTPVVFSTSSTAFCKRVSVRRPRKSIFRRPTFSRNFSQNEEFDLGYCA